VTRKAAAQQIGEIQKYHPYTLYNLLERARIFLHNKNWDARVAAGDAIECIANNVPLWRPSTGVSAMKEAAEKKEEGEEQSLFNFADFDIEKVMKRGAVLVASGGQEFDEDEAVDDKTRLVNQRKQLKQKLGFTAQFSEDGLVEDDDLINMKSKEEIERQRREEEDAKRRAEEMQAEMQLKGLSARQRIQAKRKLRQSGKNEPEPSRKKQKTEDTNGTYLLLSCVDCRGV
jgi:TATA-binding protein-associated factor